MLLFLAYIPRYSLVSSALHHGPSGSLAPIVISQNEQRTLVLQRKCSRDLEKRCQAQFKPHLWLKLAPTRVKCFFFQGRATTSDPGTRELPQWAPWCRFVCLSPLYPSSISVQKGYTCPHSAEARDVTQVTQGHTPDRRQN